MSDFAPVKLRSPAGEAHIAHSPREVNDLIFGHGYTVVGNKTVADVAPAGTPGQDASAKDTAKRESAGG